MKSADFLTHLAQRSVGQVPVPDQAAHEHVARAIVDGNPDLVRRAVETGDYIPLIRLAQDARPGLSRFWLGQRIGQLAREAIPPASGRGGDHG